MHTSLSQTRSKAYRHLRRSSKDSDPEKLLAAEASDCVVKNVERKYARRCFWSLFIVLVVAAAAIVPAVVVTTLQKKNRISA